MCIRDRRITNDCSEFAVFHQGKKVAEVKWNIVGQHNMHNALMAIAAAYHAGVKIEDACHALGLSLIHILFYP